MYLWMKLCLSWNWKSWNFFSVFQWRKFSFWRRPKYSYFCCFFAWTDISFLPTDFKTQSWRMQEIENSKQSILNWIVKMWSTAFSLKYVKEIETDEDSILIYFTKPNIFYFGTCKTSMICRGVIVIICGWLKFGKMSIWIWEKILFIDDLHFKKIFLSLFV